MSFCWLPPERATPRASGPGARTSYSRMIRSVSARALLRSMKGPLTAGGRVWWPRMRFSQSVRVEQHALAVPVLGDEAEAGLAAGPGAPGGDVVQADGQRRDGRARARRSGAQAHDRVDELGLAVALDAGDADDLALADGEVDVLDQRAAVRAVHHGDVAQLQHRRLAHGRGARLRRGQLGADHHLGQLPGRRRPRVGGADRRAPADDGDRSRRPCAPRRACAR